MLTLEAAIARRDVPGGTAPARVRQALADADARIAAMEAAP
jgi:argininosuccinate lyase